MYVVSVGVVVLLELHLIRWRLATPVNIREVLVSSRILLDVEVILILSVPLVALRSRHLVRQADLAVLLVVIDLGCSISI